MFKICTTLEQSKKLIKLGVDVNTADMRYGYIAPYDFSDRMYDGGYDEVPYPKDFLKKNADFSENEYDGELPAWSLAALLNVLPSSTLDSSDNHRYRFRCMERYTEWYDNAIDACVAMIERLHELKML